MSVFRVAESGSCYGCSACSAVCPVRAIEMRADTGGFLYPFIREEQCLNCGLCEKVCPALSPLPSAASLRESRAVQLCEEREREKSTSGGVFTALSDVILDRGGTVYGVVYDENFHARHSRAETRDERDRMRGSKYVQSNPGDSFSSVANDLAAGKCVLFTGTPCQIHGLVRYLECRKADVCRLVTCQIVCHGVPSPKVFGDHINNLETRRGSRVTAYYHRPKVRGWHEHNETVCYEDGTTDFRSKASQNHKDLFYANYSLRKSCFLCPYVGAPGEADITVGDFWGVEDLKKEIDDNCGTSIVLLNTPKGKELFELAGKECRVWEIPYEDALRYNHKKPARKPADYEAFWQDYARLPFRQITAKYAGDKFPDRALYAVKKAVRRLLVKLKIIHV